MIAIRRANRDRLAGLLCGDSITAEVESGELTLESEGPAAPLYGLARPTSPSGTGEGARSRWPLSMTGRVHVLPADEEGGGALLFGSAYGADHPSLWVDLEGGRAALWMRDRELVRLRIVPEGEPETEARVEADP